MGHIYKSLCPVQSLKHLGTVVVSLHGFQWFMCSCLWPSRIESELASVTNRLYWCADAWLTKLGNQRHWLFLLPHFLGSLTVADTSCHVLMPFKQPFYDAHVEGKLGPWIKANTKLPALQWIPLEVTHYRPSQHWLQHGRTQTGIIQLSRFFHFPQKLCSNSYLVSQPWIVV